MPSELQRVAQGLVDCLDQIPEVAGQLQQTAARLRHEAAVIGQLGTDNPVARRNALLLDAAARACEEAAHRALLAPPKARAWALAMVGGTSRHNVQPNP